ncbi:hypothetical protein ACFLXD_07045 [Chloroflexota bacterium]
MMIRVTERAKEELRNILVKHVDNPQACIRIKADDGKLGVAIDIEMPGDKTVEHEGLTLLVIEGELAGNMNHLTIDVEDTDEGNQLVIVDEFT